MNRPLKPRLFDGKLLADNLYPDNKKRPFYWRYKRPDGTFKHFTAASVEEANALAESANAKRDTHIATKGKKATTGTLSYYLPDYIGYRESTSPELKQKESWRNRKYALNQFCNLMTVPITLLSRDMIQHWWDNLTNHQQRHRHAEFRRFFNYLMGRGLLKQFEYNPFTTSDDRPKLMKRSKPKRKSERLTRDGFWRIYHAAGELGYEGLQIAMGVSLLTFMREGDVLDLKIGDHLEGDLLKRVIGKSESQKGVSGSRLKWDLANYNLLRQLINRGRELSLKNRRCPYLISHWPKQRRLGEGKTHLAQVTNRRLISMFDEARKLAGFKQSNPPTFHSIRSLADKLAVDAGYDIKKIQHAMAHSSEAMTRLYQEGHELPFEAVEVQFTKEVIGGDFNG